MFREGGEGGRGKPPPKASHGLWFMGLAPLGSHWFTVGLEFRVPGLVYIMVGLWFPSPPCGSCWAYGSGLKRLRFRIYPSPRSLAGLGFRGVWGLG